MTRLLLAAIADAGFVLAGSGAVREHGLINRPTEDVDVFTNAMSPYAFAAAVTNGIEALTAAGYRVDQVRTAELFARLEVEALDGVVLEVDLGVDWRECPPVILDLGPVLALPDAVGNKLCALYSRAEPRDFLDADAIRQSGLFSDGELLALAASHDPGFDLAMFAAQLDLAGGLHERQTAQYGVTAAMLQEIQHRLAGWAASIRADLAPVDDDGRFGAS